MPELDFRESGPVDSPEVIDLLRRCFTSNPKVDPAVMAWQYWSNPFGTTRSWVATSGGRIVAHHAAYAVPLRIDDKRPTAAIQVDTATDPDFRGHGLYGELSRRLYASCREDGVAVMLGNPNAQALGPLRRVGWVELGDLRLFVRPRDPDAASRLTGVPVAATRVLYPLLLGKTAPGDATIVPSVPDDLDALVERCRRPDEVAVDTSRRWWEWRFENHPHHPYFFIAVHEGSNLVAAAACGTRTEGDEALVDILDLVAENRAAARSVVACALDAASDASAVRFVTNSGSIYETYAAWARIPRVPRRLRKSRTYFGINTLDPSQPFDSSPWNVSLGALDYA